MRNAIAPSKPTQNLKQTLTLVDHQIRHYRRLTKELMYHLYITYIYKKKRGRNIIPGQQ